MKQTGGLPGENAAHPDGRRGKRANDRNRVGVRGDRVDATADAGSDDGHKWTFLNGRGLVPSQRGVQPTVAGTAALRYGGQP